MRERQPSKRKILPLNRLHQVPVTKGDGTAVTPAGSRRRESALRPAARPEQCEVTRVSAMTARRRCAAIAAGLDIPRPFDLEVLLARVAASRGRKIYLHPMVSGPGIPCGLWLGTAKADHIFTEAGTSPWHRTQIAVHELAHMLLGHSNTGDGALRLAGLLAPDISPALTRMFLGRSVFFTAEEREAETLASLVLTRASARPAARPAGRGPSRLQAAWG
jgi:hypothetical protein